MYVLSCLIIIILPLFAEFNQVAKIHQFVKLSLCLRNGCEMKIVLSIPGNLKTVPMNKFIADTFKNMGHDVVLFNYTSHGLFPRLIKHTSKELFYSYINITN